MVDLNAATTKRLLERFGIDGADAIAAAVGSFERSVAAFNAFAGMDAPHLPAEDHHAIQVELARWQVAQFGPTNLLEMAAGITEELGEYAVANDRLDESEMWDARGDVMVYCSQLATLQRFTVHGAFMHSAMAQAWTKSVRPGFSANAQMSAAGLLSHVALKGRQKIRGFDNVELERFGAFLGVSNVIRVTAWAQGHRVLWSTFERVAAKILRRNWKGDAQTGGE